MRDLDPGKLEICARYPDGSCTFGTEAFDEAALRGMYAAIDTAAQNAAWDAATPYRVDVTSTALRYSLYRAATAAGAELSIELKSGFLADFGEGGGASEVVPLGEPLAPEEYADSSAPAGGGGGGGARLLW